MARRKRNYKAEYARRKTRAVAKGYKTPHHEYRARKALGLSRIFPSLRLDELPDFAFEKATGADITRRRQEAQDWSDAHSHVKASRYRRNMSQKQLDDYWRAYVEPYEQLGPSRRKRAKERRLRIFEYMTKYGYPIEGRQEDWKSDRAPA